MCCEFFVESFYYLNVVVMPSDGWQAFRQLFGAGEWLLAAALVSGGFPGTRLRAFSKSQSYAFVHPIGFLFLNLEVSDVRIQPAGALLHQPRSSLRQDPIPVKKNQNYPLGVKNSDPTSLSLFTSIDIEFNLGKFLPINLLVPSVKLSASVLPPYESKCC